MARQLAAFTHAPDESGLYHGFPAGTPEDALPSWAVEFITNPKCWEGEPDEADEDESDGEPDESWKVADLKEYAAAHSIDLAGASNKAEILAALAGSQSGN